MRLIYAGILLSLASLGASLGFADTITLKNGRVIEGTYLGGTARTLRVDDGVNVRTFDVSDVQRIEFGSVVLCRVRGMWTGPATSRRCGERRSSSGSNEPNG